MEEVMEDFKNWEEQIESAFTDVINAGYKMFMALDMDKDKRSHASISEDTWGKLEKMVEDHKEIASW